MGVCLDSFSKRRRTRRLRDLHGAVDSPLVLNGPPSTPFVPIGTSSDGRWIASSSAEGQVVLWDTQARLRGRLKRTLDARSKIGQLSFSPDDRWLVAGNHDGSYAIWNLSDSGPATDPHVIGKRELSDEAAGVHVISSDSRILATGHSTRARAWRIRTSASTRTARQVLWLARCWRRIRMRLLPC